jgi:hypothetical protein
VVSDRSVTASVCLRSGNNAPARLVTEPELSAVPNGFTIPLEEVLLAIPSRQAASGVPPMVESFSEILFVFRDELAEAHHRTLELSEETEPRVTRSLDWLLATRNPEGDWGYGSPGGTALCCLALHTWRPVAASYSLPGTVDWLTHQSDEGSWETTWDTAISARAIYLLDPRRSRILRKARECLLAYDPGADWRANPHHAAQILSALAVFGESTRHLDPWSDMLRELLNQEDYRMTLEPSVQGQVLHALVVYGDCAPSSVSKTVDSLALYLDSSRMSNAGFLDHVHALQGLAATKSHHDVVGKTLDTLFSDAYRPDGSWYHEPFMTAWALLALKEAHAVERVMLELPALNSYVERCIRSVRDLALQERKDRRLSVSVGFALGASLTTLVAIEVLYGGESRLITGLVITVLTAIFFSSFRFVRNRFR